MADLVCKGVTRHPRGKYAISDFRISDSRTSLCCLLKSEIDHLKSRMFKSYHASQRGVSPARGLGVVAGAGMTVEPGGGVTMIVELGAGGVDDHRGGAGDDRGRAGQGPHGQLIDDLDHAHGLGRQRECLGLGGVVGDDPGQGRDPAGLDGPARCSRWSGPCPSGAGCRPWRRPPCCGRSVRVFWKPPCTACPAVWKPALHGPAGVVEPLADRPLLGPGRAGPAQTSANPSGRPAVILSRVTSSCRDSPRERDVDRATSSPSIQVSREPGRSRRQASRAIVNGVALAGFEGRTR